MNIKAYRLLHYLLIILLMLAPFRAVIAMSSPHCEMDDMTASHDMAMMSSGETMLHHNPVADTPVVDTASIKHQCCCCDSGNCAGNCELGMTVSLIMLQSNFAPAIIDVSASVMISSSLVMRALTPPSRPPATFT